MTTPPFSLRLTRARASPKYRMAFLQTCWLMATASRNTVADRVAYLNLACRFQRLCAVRISFIHRVYLPSSRQVLTLSSAYRFDWHDYVGCWIPLSRQSLQPGVLDHLACGLDLGDCNVYHGTLQTMLAPCSLVELRLSLSSTITWTPTPAVLVPMPALM